VSIGEALTRTRAALGSDAEFHWVDDGTLLRHEVVPWTGLPLWIPASVKPGFMAVDCSAARAQGLRTRALEATARDTLAWHGERGAPWSERWLSPAAESLILDEMATTGRPRPDAPVMELS
jgi:2'-hydroxyisoflavone reductase